MSSSTATRLAPAQDVGKLQRGGPVHGRQGAAVQVEPGDRLEDLVGPDEDRHVRVRVQHVSEPGQPLGRHEEGARPVPGGQGAAAGPWSPRRCSGPLAGSVRLAQCRVGERRVVGDPRVLGRVQEHQPLPQSGANGRADCRLGGDTRGHQEPMKSLATMLASATRPSTTMTARSQPGESLRPTFAPMNPPMSEPTAINSTTGQWMRSGAKIR